ncbi:N-acetylglucosamine-binding protein GbpA [Pseudomonas sp. R5(2019)]|uniref:N-acetylglucosamine-binding protein GbpA n=1 Tax=Pseudomonas sp. R5(2019) TaxID=2697566 RepID=UPI0014134208|nr:N-acetylglucosamine-binding protein GbpA [Pseudomonas sp. R5(2019)]NBA96207.1 N-acetylglucosamine-binding protein GbpA [Pseudomonas sp. R5(2019)]
MTPKNNTRALLCAPLALTAAIAAGLSAQQASAHGYIESPKSRSFSCHSTGGSLNTDCGPVTYDYQSVEYQGDGRDGIEHYPSKAQSCQGSFTDCGPANGHIAAGGMNGFSKINEQTATRWNKTTVQPGLNDFKWKYTIGHKTTNWQFFITKKDWNPNQPLTRDSFELTPLLTEQGNGNPAGSSTTHKVNIPADRSGYHIVLGTWEINDTKATFYQVVDVNIENGDVPPSEWSDIGAVVPETLKIGDKVSTRVFSGIGEQHDRQTQLTISSTEQGHASQWPFELAEKVNRANHGYKIGELNSEDEVVPVHGRNSVYTKADSDVTRVEILKEVVGVPGELKLTGLKDSYALEQGAVDLHFGAMASGGVYTLNATLFNSKGESVAFKQGATSDNAPHFSLAVKDASAGKYDLVVVAQPAKGSLIQQTRSLTFTEATVGGDHDHVFPESLSSYRAGTTVLQPKDGNIYECKPFPNSGYCIQWSQSATQFEPGTGSHWEMAWTRK